MIFATADDGLATRQCSFAHDKEGSMPQDSDKWKGRAKQAGGKAKEVAGKVTGDEELEARGKADQIKGKAQETAGKVKEKVKDAVD
jgi:uncharacterized protein YjbJ (UPF0337 family)